MNMTMNHIASELVPPCEQWVMAQRNPVIVKGCSQHTINAQEIVLSVDFGHPATIMVACNQPLLSL